MCSISIILGNAGGYLGLFLGYALLNVPTLLVDAYKWLEEKYTLMNVQGIKPSTADVERVED